MPCKNAALYLKECLESIRNQSWPEWELIVIDDASSDHSFDILKSFSRIDSRIKVLKNRGEGIIDALEMGFESSKGAWIHRMDADDVMPREKLEILFQTLEGRKDAVATGKVKYFSKKEVSAGYQRYQDWLNDLDTHDTMNKNRYRECVVASPNWLVHRSCFESKIKIHELTYPEDFDMTLKWFKHEYEVLKSNEVTHFWREHPERTSRTSEDYQQAAFFRMKVNHWIDECKSPKNEVNIIGNNQKSKLTAKYLSERGVRYASIKFENKQLTLDSGSNQLYILCNWPIEKKTQTEIQDFLKTQGLEFGKNIWLF